MSFRHALSRGGWYHGWAASSMRAATRVSDELETGSSRNSPDATATSAGWPTTSPGRPCTRPAWSARTHYLVGIAGDGSDDFLQLEIEDLQEMRAHRCSPAIRRASRNWSIRAAAASGRSRSPALLTRLPPLQHIGVLLRRMLAPAAGTGADPPDDRTTGCEQRRHASAYANHWVIATRDTTGPLPAAGVPRPAYPDAGREPPEIAAVAGTSAWSQHCAIERRSDREAG
jgi:hypothetical protein